MYHIRTIPVGNNLTLHLDNTSYTINSFALNPEGSWISFSFMDPGLLHATLGIVALHRDILTGNEQSALSLRYKGQAIHTINIRLKSGAQPVNDENLALVALLIKFEVRLSLPFCDDWSNLIPDAARNIGCIECPHEGTGGDD